MNELSMSEVAGLLELSQHPEGGYFKEVYRSALVLPGNTVAGFPSDRHVSTSIYFLIGGQQFSAFHRIRSDELWHFYAGQPLHVHVIAPDGAYSLLRVGNDFAAGYKPQAVVAAGSWFASESATPDGWSLVGCTVAPGFDFADFELAAGEALSRQFPQHAELIRRLCRQ